MNNPDNYLHEFLRAFFANRRLIKRLFLSFAVITLLLPLALKQSFEITAEVIVQSKKLSQTDPRSSLTPETDKFVPPSLADMETESNILRSPTLIRETLSELVGQGLYAPRTSLFDKLFFEPFKNFVTDPLRLHIVNPTRTALGMAIDPLRDTALDSLTSQTIKNLDIGALPGANVISIRYAHSDPAEGTLFVELLLANYLKSRQLLQSNELPETFYKQKKAQYEQRLDDLETQRLRLLESARSSDPKEEITFRLNAINAEEQALNTYQDRALESQQWLAYLNQNLQSARKAHTDDYVFPFTFTHNAGNGVYEDREIKQIGEQLTEQVAHLGKASSVFHNNSLPIQEQREQIARTRQQFFQVVENRIRERSSELNTIKAVIAQKTTRIDEYQNRIRQLQEVQSKLRQLDTEIEALHKAFFTYTQHYEESRSQQMISGEMSNARVLSHPYEPAEPAFPKPLFIIPLGLLTSLLLAIALAYIREFFDHRFKHPGQVAKHLNLPVLLVIDHATTGPNAPYANNPRS